MQCCEWFGQMLATLFMLCSLALIVLVYIYVGVDWANFFVAKLLSYVYVNELLELFWTLLVYVCFSRYALLMELVVFHVRYRFEQTAIKSAGEMKNYLFLKHSIDPISERMSRRLSHKVRSMQHSMTQSLDGLEDSMQSSLHDFGERVYSVSHASSSAEQLQHQHDKRESSLRDSDDLPVSDQPHHHEGVLLSLRSATTGESLQHELR